MTDFDQHMSSPSSRTFWVRLLLCVAFVAPVGYVASIFAVAVHEILGHGCTAWLVGGSFTGFALLPDAMGWAVVSSSRYENAVLGAGVVASIVIGSLLAWMAGRSYDVLSRTVLLVFSAASLMEGTPYIFWNSLFPRPPGDLGRILMNYDSGTLRWALLLIFGIAYLVLTVALNVAVFRCFESVAGPFSRRRAAFVSWLLFGIVGGAAWFTFDWNQLIQDIGRLPQYVGGGLQVACAPLLVALRRAQVNPALVSSRRWTVSIAAAWLAVALVAAVLLLWLQHGVYWSDG